MSYHPVGIQNVSTVVSDDEVQHYIEAINRFYPSFATAWHLDPTQKGVDFVPRGTVPAKGRWLQIIADNADQAGALGYHETRAGVPIGYTFAATDLKYGASISVTLTHELWEMKADPFINQYVTGPDGRQWAYENGDAVEADKFAISVQMTTGPDVLLSDFVLPRYFNFGAKHGPFDYRGLLKSPIPAMLPGGYLAYQWPDGSWGQINASHMAMSNIAQQQNFYSRYNRRIFSGHEVAQRLTR